MPYPHTIRLRGPWQFSVLSRAVQQPVDRRDAFDSSRGRVNLPSDWGNTLGADFRGCVRYSRNFNRPTGLDPHERVWCVIEGIDPAGSVTLNGQALGCVAGYAMSASFDITLLIQDHNELTLDVEMPDSFQRATPRPGREHLPGGAIGEVRLEIRTGHFIEGLGVYPLDCADIPELHVVGEIAGEASSTPLAVVVNACQRELLFAEFHGGKVFHLHAPAAELPVRQSGVAECPLAAVEIRLLAGGACVWQTKLETAVEPMVWNAAARRLTLAGEPVTFPLPTLTATELVPSRHFLTDLRKQPSVVWASRQILSENWYTALDRNNLRVVQAIPPTWAAKVCPRLAHHPSIVAWAAALHARNDLSGDFQTEGLFGRPWLKAEEVLETPGHQ